VWSCSIAPSATIKRGEDTGAEFLLCDARGSSLMRGYPTICEETSIRVYAHQSIIMTEIEILLEARAETRHLQVRNRLDSRRDNWSSRNKREMIIRVSSVRSNVLSCFSDFPRPNGSWQKIRPSDDFIIHAMAQEFRATRQSVHASLGINPGTLSGSTMVLPVCQAR
jgi:hypothetical protein